MGSNGPSYTAAAPAGGGGREEERDDDIVVVVTGFGPFKAQFPINPSWEITASLPPFILASSNTNTTTTAGAMSPQRIRIVIHPSPVRVSYATVRALVPTLWTTAAPKIDFMIHVGMAGGRDFYSVERRGHREGYYMPDVDGVVWEEGGKEEELEDGEGGGGGDGGGRYGVGGRHLVREPEKETEKKKGVWDGCPAELETEVDLDDVWTRWRAALPNIDVRPSEDAGHYLCDFIYYASLAHLWAHDQARRVVFLHVPVDSDDAAIERGRVVLVELIRALVQSRIMEGGLARARLRRGVGEGRGVERS